MSDKTVAAIDLGSNSFHLIVANIINDEIKIIDRHREMVRLGAGLNGKRQLDAQTGERALACLERFGQRLRELETGQVLAVGTNTLRSMRNPNAFLKKAKQALGHPIKIIAGIEEARLIYQGVAHSLENSNERRMVIDIGGGSTEVIIGESFTPLNMESLYMGCVSQTQAFFNDGKITAKSMKKAVLAGRVELEPHETHFRTLGWAEVVGASGTIRAIDEVLRNAGLSDSGITLKGLNTLRDMIVDAGHINKLNLPGLSAERAPVFPGGFAILLALFKSLKIESMKVSDWALREGLLYDLFGRMHRDDIRERTVSSWVETMRIDKKHAARVSQTAEQCLDMVSQQWKLNDEESRNFLRWSARLHEIGLTIAHNHYHKHGAYIVENADMPGFSRQEQTVLAFLVIAHRRKFPLADYLDASLSGNQSLLQLAVLLRFSVILNRGHSSQELPSFKLVAADNVLKISFPPGWLDEHPLTKLDLEQEKKYLKAAEFKITID